MPQDQAILTKSPGPRLPLSRTPGGLVLEALATDKYLRKVPLDPITESTTTWQVVAPEDPQKTGVFDVKSGAPGKALDGTEFSTW